MIDYLFELPHNNPMSGGVHHTLNVAAEMDAHVRFNQITHRRHKINSPMSVGFPDNAFPKCRYAITYSDTLYLGRLLKLRQVNKVAVLMLSYGMAIERERANALANGVTVLTSTLRNQLHIEADGGKCHHVGFGFEPAPFYIITRPRPIERYAALYRHPESHKRYSLAASVAARLCHKGVLDGFLTFGEGTVPVNNMEQHCKGHLPNATISDLRELFNRCSVFIMPSVSEGLNRTPAEATLCGCPSVLCDGAKDELYFPDVNCKWVPKDSHSALLHAAEDILSNDYVELWADDMRQRVVPCTLEAMAGRIREVMETSL